MPADDAAPLHPIPPVTWQHRPTAGAGLQLCHAVLETPARPVFAAIEECHQPPGMWRLTMFPKGRQRQFAVYFDGMDKAMRAVELWAHHYWTSIDGALARDPLRG